VGQPAAVRVEVDIDDFPVRVLATVEALAASRGDGALLVLEVEKRSLERLRRSGALDERVASLLLQAADVAENSLPHAGWARAAWSRFECALPGGREELTEVAKTLLASLLEQPALRPLCWRAVLTRVFPGEALRTLYCDPANDLAGIDGSLVAWVEPYAEDDWQESQRYPTTTIVWKAS
jgi:hypothetical protein